MDTDDWEVITRSELPAAQPAQLAPSFNVAYDALTQLSAAISLIQSQIQTTQSLIANATAVIPKDIPAEGAPRAEYVHAMSTAKSIQEHSTRLAALAASLHDMYACAEVHRAAWCPEPVSRCLPDGEPISLHFPQAADVQDVAFACIESLSAYRGVALTTYGDVLDYHVMDHHQAGSDGSDTTALRLTVSPIQPRISVARALRGPLWTVVEIAATSRGCAARCAHGAVMAWSSSPDGTTQPVRMLGPFISQAPSADARESLLVVPKAAALVSVKTWIGVIQTDGQLWAWQPSSDAPCQAFAVKHGGHPVRVRHATTAEVGKQAELWMSGSVALIGVVPAHAALVGWRSSQSSDPGTHQLVCVVNTVDGDMRCVPMLPLHEVHSSVPLSKVWGNALEPAPLVLRDRQGELHHIPVHAWHAVLDHMQRAKFQLHGVCVPLLALPHVSLFMGGTLQVLPRPDHIVALSTVGKRFCCTYEGVEQQWQVSCLPERDPQSCVQAGLALCPAGQGPHRLLTLAYPALSTRYLYSSQRDDLEVGWPRVASVVGKELSVDWTTALKGLRTHVKADAKGALHALRRMWQQRGEVMFAANRAALWSLCLDVYDVLPAEWPAAREVRDGEGEVSAAATTPTPSAHVGMARTHRQIDQDVARTLPYLSLYHRSWAISHTSLVDILRKFAQFDLHTGYVQGLNALAAFVVTMCQSDATAYSILQRMTRHAGLLAFLRVDTPVLDLVYQAFDLTLRLACPAVSRHLRQEDVQVSMFLYPWLQSLLLRCLPVHIAVHCIDGWLVMGTSYLLRAAVAVLQLLLEQLPGAGTDLLMGALTTASSTWLRPGEVPTLDLAVKAAAWGAISGPKFVSATHAVALPDEVQVVLQYVDRMAASTNTEERDEWHQAASRTLASLETSILQQEAARRSRAHASPDQISADNRLLSDERLLRAVVENLAL